VSKTLKSSALNYGLISGISLTVLYVLLYVLKIELLASFAFGLLILLALLVVGFISTAKAKKINEGYLSFQEAFSAFIIPFIIGLAIPTIFIYILFNFIDTDSAEMLKEMGLEKAEEIMRRFGAPESEIEKAMIEAEKEDSYGLQKTALQYAGTVVFAALIGLIAALTMRKKKDV
jgi:hypothetical protein